jgi:hypothetical protein
MKMLAKSAIFGALAAAACALPAASAPIAASSGLAVAADANAVVQHVQWRRGGDWRGGRWIGPAVGAAIVGGAIAASRPWYGYYGYGPGYYYEDDYAYVPAPGYVDSDAVAYCQQRFRSYDPASGTYLGYDGLRHPCP